MSKLNVFLMLKSMMKLNAWMCYWRPYCHLSFLTTAMFSPWMFSTAETDPTVYLFPLYSRVNYLRRVQLWLISTNSVEGLQDRVWRCGRPVLGSTSLTYAVSRPINRKQKSKHIKGIYHGYTQSSTLRPNRWV